MSSITAIAPCAASRAASLGRQWLAPTKPITVIPAATAAVTPGRLSSIATQRSGGTPIRSAAWRNRSGAGLPWATSTGVKAVVEADQRQGMAQPIGPAAGGDASLAGQCINDGAHAGDGLQLAVEERPQTPPPAVGEIGRQPAMPGLEIGHHRGKADAGIALEDLVDRQFDAAFGESFSVGAD